MFCTVDLISNNKGAKKAKQNNLQQIKTKNKQHPLWHPKHTQKTELEEKNFSFGLNGKFSLVHRCKNISIRMLRLLCLLNPSNHIWINADPSFNNLKKRGTRGYTNRREREHKDRRRITALGNKQTNKGFCRQIQDPDADGPILFA